MLRIIYWVLGILGVLVMGVVVAALVIDWEQRAEGMLSAALGRDVSIGSLDIRPGWTTEVRVSDLEIDNPDWAQADHLATLGEGRVAVKVWPLITGDIEIPELVLREPDINLEKDSADKVSWRFGDGAVQGGNVAPDDGGELPAIGRLVIEDGSLRYRDATRDLDVKGKLATATADAAGQDAITVSLEGSAQGRPIILDFTGGSMVRLQETEKPYPVDFELRSGNTRIRAEGTVTKPVQMAGFDIDLSIVGPTLGDIFPILNVPLPDTPPYSLDGALAKEGERWRFENFSGVVGDSDLSGSLYLDQGRKPPFLKADLLSNRLDFDDLAGLVGGEPEEEKREGLDDGLFPDEPIAADRLHAMNMDVSFKGTEVLAPNLPIEQLKFRVQVDDGRALFRPLSLNVADGTISGEAALNARQAVPSADADLTFERLDLQPFFEGTEFLREMGGRFSGHAYVLGAGRTVAEMADTARGEAAIAMRDGSISGLIVEAAGLDVAEALGLVVGGDARIGIRCGRVNVDVDKGRIKIEKAILDTTDSVLVSDGVVDIGEQTLDVQVEARAKDFSLIDVAAPVRAYGSLTNPSVAIGGIDPLPFFEVGDQESLGCDALVSGAVSQEFDKKSQKHGQ